MLKEKKMKSNIVAKKSHKIRFGDWDKKTDKMEYHYDIEKGQDVSDLPKKVLDILKREKVI